MAELDWGALKTPDFATNALKASTLGREDGLALAKQNALRQYASDPQGGIQALMAVDPQSAVVLQKAQAEQRQQASQVQAGQAAASGDLEGAAKVAYGAGNFDLASKIQGMTKEQRDQASAAFGQLASAAQSVKSIPYEKRKAALAQMAPSLQPLGISQQQLESFDPTDEHIDAQVRQALGVKGQIDEARKQRDDAKPSFTEVQDGPTKKLVQTNPMADGAQFVDGRWVMPDGSPAAAASPGAAPAPSPSSPAQPSAAPAQTGGGQPPLGIRNNNPLNVKPLAQGQWNGQTGVGEGGYAQFQSPEAGWAAADKNLSAYGVHHGINTISGVISRWAPQGDGNNDPQAYAATVSQALGIRPDQPIDLTDPTVRQKVLSAMAQVELGRPYTPPTQGAAPQGQPPAPQPPQSAPQVPAGQPPAGQPGVPGGWQPRTVMTGAAPPKIEKMTDANGIEHMYDVTDPAHPKQLDVGGQPNDANANLTGEAFLKTLPAPVAAQVKMIAEGRQAPPSASSRSPQAQALLRYAAQYDPTGDYTTWQGRAKTRTDFSPGGKSGQNVTSLNTALGHLDDLDRAVDNLHNTPLQWVNEPAQWIGQNVGDPHTQAAIADFNAKKKAAADELTRVFRGSSGNESDIQGYLRELNEVKSPTALHSTVKAMVRLLASRLDALSESRDRGMSTSDQLPPLLTPRAQRAFDRLIGDTEGQAPAAAPPPAAAPRVIRYDAHGNRVQ